MEIKDINMIEPAERSELSDEEYNKILLAQRQREYDEVDEALENRIYEYNGCAVYIQWNEIH